MSQAKKSTIEKSKMAKKSEKHPPYATMIKAAIKSLDADRGSSRHAILKYITENYKITSKFVNKYVNAALKKGVQNGNFKQAKGATGSFKLGDKKKKKRKSKPKAKTTESKTKATKEAAINKTKS